MNILQLLLVFLPLLLAFATLPLAVRALAGFALRRQWIFVVGGWAIVSTLAFAVFYESALSAQGSGDGVLAVIGFVFWNGLLMLAGNGAVALAAILLRRRRR